jgi:membrane protease YdiL (CAAX protease family)
MEFRSTSKVKGIFISSTERRLRAGWRLFIQSGILLIFLIAGSIPLAFLGFFGMDLNNLDMTLGGIVSLIAVTLSVFISRKFIDRRKIISLGLTINIDLVKDLLIGFLIPALMMGLIFITEWLLGWLEINSFAWNSVSTLKVLFSLGSAFLLYLAVSWQEELLSRGYHLQNLEDGTNTLWGVILSSLIFSLLHLLNPHASWTSVLGITLAGFFLCYAYLRTRQLWLPMGLHIGWNFFQGPVFGFPVSGTSSFTLINQTSSGPILFTGGLFGPEAGLILLPALLIGTLAVYLYTQNRLQSNPFHER